MGRAGREAELKEEMRQASAEPECDAQSRAALTSFSARLDFALKVRRTRKGPGEGGVRNEMEGTL